MISTSHSLPFRCVYSKGVFEQGLPGCIHVRFANPQGSQEIVTAVEAFLALGSYGALCGTGIDPVRSAIAAQRVEPATPGQLRWSLDAPSVADDALVVLAHLLMRAHSAAAINLVEVLSSAVSSLSELRTDQDESTFPGEYGALPFVLEGDGLQGEDYAFELELERPLQPASEDWLNEMLAAWSRVVLLGGYAEAPTLPKDAYVEPDERVIHYDSNVEWALFKLRADGASIDSLLNGLAAFNGRCQRIQMVEML